MKQDEKILGFTLDNKCDLDTFVGDAKSCVYHGDVSAIHSLITGEFNKSDIYILLVIGCILQEPFMVLKEDHVNLVN